VFVLFALPAAKQKAQTLQKIFSVACGNPKL